MRPRAACKEYGAAVSMEGLENATIRTHAHIHKLFYMFWVDVSGHKDASSAHGFKVSTWVEWKM